MFRNTFEYFHLSCLWTECIAIDQNERLALYLHCCNNPVSTSVMAQNSKTEQAITLKLG